MKYLLCGTLLFVIIFHFLFVNILPVGMQPDELEVVLSGYTYRHYGVDLAGYGLPLSMWATQAHGVISPLPPLVYAALFWLVEPSQWVVRLVPTLLMLGAGMWVFLMVELLFKRRELAWMVTLVFLISPWQWHYAHYAADTPFALFFFVGAIYFLLREKFKYWWVGLAFLVVGFFSYHGAKLLFLPVLFFCLTLRPHGGLHRYSSFVGKPFRMTVIVGLFGFTLFGLYMMVLFSMKGSIVAQRGEQLFFMNKKFGEEVDYERKRQIANPLSSLMVNKVTVGTRIFLSNYLTSFAPDTLLVAGDTSVVNRWYMAGMMYRTDMVAILVGIIFLFRRYRKQGLLLGALILVAPLPSALSNFSASVMHRSFLLVALLPIISGLGYFAVYEFTRGFVKSRVYDIFIGLCIVSVLLLQFISFWQFYMLRLPLVNPDAQYWGMRVLAEYAKRGEDVYVADIEPRASALTMLFYGDERLRKEYLVPGNFRDLGEEFKVGKAVFGMKCPTDENNIRTMVIHRDLAHCRDSSSGFKAILSPKDGGIYYRVYNDRICAELNLQMYTYPYTVSDFDFNQRIFCERWVNKPIQME